MALGARYHQQVNNNIQSESIPSLPSSPWSFTLYFIKKFKWPVGTIALFEIAQKISEILIPYAFKGILDGAVNYKGPSTEVMTALKEPLTFFLVISLCTVVFSRIGGAILVYTGPRLRKVVRRTIYHFLQHQSHRYFISNFAGSLSNRINEIAMGVAHGLWTVLFDFLPVTISFSVSLYLLSTAQTQLGLFLLGWVAIYVAVSFFMARRCQLLAKDFAAARSKTTGHIVDAVTNIMNTKLFANMGFERKRLDGQLDSEIAFASRTFWYMEKMRWFQFTAALILQLGLITYALHFYSLGLITVGEFAMSASLGLLVINDAKGLSRRFLEFFEYMGNISDGVKIIIKPHEILDKPNAKDLVVKTGKIEIQNMNFGYSENNLVFENLNLTIPHGQKVGLVGFSGSGKSTFANLLLRLFDVKSGQILIDGQNIAECTQDSLRSQISMIPQDPMLFHRTLRENIRYGNLNATDEQIEEAAIKANAHEFILKTPKQYEALVGERGVKLSGGQRQRIAIARAILKEAPVLILDEATSSLDSVTERSIQNTFTTAMKNKTVIVIAHRLSTLSQMDRILVFDQGKVVEDGTHNELISKGGHYFRLWSLQAGGFLPSEKDEPEVFESKEILL